MTPDEFRAIRKSLGLTQEALAERLGQHRITISRYERGREPIPPVVALAMQALRDQAA